MNHSLIQQPSEWDPGVVVGYRPTREVADLTLVLGSSSHLRTGTVIYLGSRIGANFETGHHAVVREEVEIGDDCNLWSNSIISYGVKIGHRVRIHANVFICEYTSIEDEVFIGPGVVMSNDPHPGCAFSRPCMKGPLIRRGARIGANVTLLPRVEIGETAVIGAGAVVTTSIPRGMVAVGVPARTVCSIHDLLCSTSLTDKPYPAKESDLHDLLHSI